MINEKENEIRLKVADFVKTSLHNGLAAQDGMKIYDGPLVGFADAGDYFFHQFRKPEIIAPVFLLPKHWLPGAKSVISYFLPFTKAVLDTNRKPGPPSDEWVSARIDGEAFNNKIRAFLADILRRMGGEAVAPCLDPRFKIVNQVSNWSERHVAYAAGLGMFGLHRALITPKGSAGRFGSVVTTLELSPTVRNYHRFDEYCLFLTRGICETCMRRCPSAAISEKGKDNKICSDYFDREILTKGYVCAKCNIAAPCESGIPTVKKYKS